VSNVPELNGTKLEVPEPDVVEPSVPALEVSEPNVPKVPLGENVKLDNTMGVPDVKLGATGIVAGFDGDAVNTATVLLAAPEVAPLLSVTCQDTVRFGAVPPWVGSLAAEL
jgi:hypothetical protein